MLSRRDVLATTGGTLAAALAPRPAHAEYPDRPVRIVVPYAAGGGNDLIARIFAAKLSEVLGQPFVVDNRAGAGGLIGTEAVIRARPDGATLLAHGSGPVLWEPGTGRPAYDRQADLTPVAMLGAFSGMVLVRNDAPYPAVADLVTWLRASPGRANYGTGGPGFQLLGAYFAQRVAAQMEAIVYRSTAEAVTALLAGDVVVAFSDPGPARPAIEGGQVRPIAVTAATRMTDYPAVPTMLESGYPDFVVDYWTGLFGPAGLPDPMLQRLSDAVRRIAALPDVRQRLALNAVVPRDPDPAAFRRIIVANDALWLSVARSAGISLER